MTRIAVINSKTGVTENVLAFDGAVSTPPEHYRYVEDRALVASIGKVQTDEELAADPAPKPPEPDPRPPLQEQIDALNSEVDVLSAEVDALKAEVEAPRGNDRA